MASAARGSWVLSDELWARVEPLLPEPKRDPVGRGRPRVDARRIFAGILYVLRNGCLWKAVPREFGSGSTLHRRFQEWERDGVFMRIWQVGLAEYDDLVGIAWEWQSIDGAMTKAPLGGEATGPNPTDRGKKRHEAKPAGGRPWRPAVHRRNRSQSTRHDLGPGCPRGDRRQPA